MIGVELRTLGEIFRHILKTHLHTSPIVVRISMKKGTRVFLVLLNITFFIILCVKNTQQRGGEYS